MNPELGVDLPVCIYIGDAQRHDCITFFPALQQFHRNVPGLRIDYFLEDNAFSYEPMAEVLLKEGIAPLSDLSSYRKVLKNLPEGITMRNNGIPCCEGECPMALVRNIEESRCWEFGCPLRNGQRASCPKADECAFNKEDVVTLVINPRESAVFFSVIPRDSELFRTLYNLRSGSERVNKRILCDFHMDELMSRNVDHRSFLFALAAICIHQDSWIKAGIRPEGPVSRELVEYLIPTISKKYAWIFDLIDRPHLRGTKVKTEEYMENLLIRNREERIRNQAYFAQAKTVRDLIRAEINTQPAWQCPRDVLEERKKTGQSATELITEEPKISFILKIPYEERYFTQSWEKTLTIDLEQSVILDPEGSIEKLWREEHFPPKKGEKWSRYVEFFIPEPKKGDAPPRTYHGYTEVKEGVWVRPAPVLWEYEEKPKPSPERPSPMPGFKPFDPIAYSLDLNNFQSDTYRPRRVPGIEWKEDWYYGSICFMTGKEAEPFVGTVREGGHAPLEGGIPPGAIIDGGSAVPQGSAAASCRTMQEQAAAMQMETEPRCNSTYRWQPIPYEYVWDRHMVWYGPKSGYVER